MVTTIEADIENGKIIGPNAAKLPAVAHVLITLIGNYPNKRPTFGTKTSGAVKVMEGAFDPLTDMELQEWGL